MVIIWASETKSVLQHKCMVLMNLKDDCVIVINKFHSKSIGQQQ